MARIHGRIDPEDYADLLYRLGRWFNDALIVAENNNHGLVVLKRLVRLQYREIYTERPFDKVSGRERDKLGFTTTTQSRSFGLGCLASEIAKKRIQLSEEQLDECQNFTTQDGKRWEAAAGWHDDEVLALVFLCAVNRDTPFDHREPKEKKTEAPSIVEDYERRLALQLATADAGDAAYDAHMGSEW